MTAIPPDLIEMLRGAQRIAVLTGSGVSAESGVPTFRDAQTGLWENFRPEELATPEAFERNPKLVWEWYVWRRELVAEAEPNPAHLALAELQRAKDPEAPVEALLVEIQDARGDPRTITEVTRGEDIGGSE